MAKKRKTKEQKIIADLRRKLGTQVSAPKAEPSRAPTTKITPVSHHLPTFQIPIAKPQESAKVLIQHDYSYLSGGLKKVGILTGLAILIQVVLYLLLRA
ncbi:MAG: hypothetical protein Q8P89_00820 [bacterium]|nr:hypothetical protein [bacterium]